MNFREFVNNIKLNSIIKREPLVIIRKGFKYTYSNSIGSFLDEYSNGIYSPTEYLS